MFKTDITIKTSNKTTGTIFSVEDTKVKPNTKYRPTAKDKNGYSLYQDLVITFDTVNGKANIKLDDYEVAYTSYYTRPSDKELLNFKESYALKEGDTEVIYYKDNTVVHIGELTSMIDTTTLYIIGFVTIVFIVLLVIGLKQDEIKIF